MLAGIKIAARGGSKARKKDKKKKKDKKRKHDSSSSEEDSDASGDDDERRKKSKKEKKAKKKLKKKEKKEEKKRKKKERRRRKAESSSEEGSASSDDSVSEISSAGEERPSQKRRRVSDREEKDFRSNNSSERTPHASSDLKKEGDDFFMQLLGGGEAAEPGGRMGERKPEPKMKQDEAAKPHARELNVSAYGADGLISTAGTAGSRRGPASWALPDDALVGDGGKSFQRKQDRREREARQNPSMMSQPVKDFSDERAEREGPKGGKKGKGKKGDQLEDDIRGKLLAAEAEDGALYALSAIIEKHRGNAIAEWRKRGEHNSALLHIMAVRGYARVTEKLVKECGCDMNVQRLSDACTPLHLAIWHHRDHCARKLEQLGADRNIQNNYGEVCDQAYRQKAKEEGGPNSQRAMASSSSEALPAKGRGPVLKGSLAAGGKGKGPVLKGSLAMQGKGTVLSKARPAPPGKGMSENRSPRSVSRSSGSPASRRSRGRNSSPRGAPAAGKGAKGGGKGSRLLARAAKGGGRGKEPERRSRERRRRDDSRGRRRSRSRDGRRSRSPDRDRRGGDGWRKTNSKKEDAFANLGREFGGGSRGGSSGLGGRDDQFGDSGPSSQAEKVSTDITGLDVTEIRAKAIEAMLDGDQETHDKLMELADNPDLNKNVVYARERKSAPTIPQTHADLTKPGLPAEKYTPTVATKGSLRNVSMTMEKGEVKDYYKDDRNLSLDDMVRKTRLEGADEYEENYAKHIIDKGRKFHMGNVDDEDEALTLGDWEKKGKKLAADKYEKRHEQAKNFQAKRGQKNLEKCYYCPDSKRFAYRNSMLSVSANAYLALENHKMAFLPHEMVIAPTQHTINVNDADDSTAEEIRNYQKCLVQYFDQFGKVPVFTELCKDIPKKDQVQLGGGQHCVIHCYPLDAIDVPVAKSFFKQALNEAESEFERVHKAIIETDRKGVRGKVAKNFPYFHVDFGLQGGFAHVVDDKDNFRANFVKEILSGVLECDLLGQRGYGGRDDFDKEFTKVKNGFAKFDWAQAQLQAAASSGK